MKAGVGDHLHGLFPLLGLDLLLQKDIHPERIDASVGHRHQVGGLWPAAGDIAQPLQAATYLPGQGFLTGHVEQKVRPEGVSQKDDSAQDQDAQDQDQATTQPPGPRAANHHRPLHCPVPRSKNLRPYSPSSWRGLGPACIPSPTTSAGK